MRIGIDLGGTKIAGTVLDDQGRAVLSHRIATPAGNGYPAVLAALCSLVLKLEQDAGVRCTVGIGTPGQLSRVTHTIKNSNATCLNAQPLLADLERQLRREVRLANDANCFTLSEAIDGAAAGHRVVFGVILGTGVGGGLSIGQQIEGGRHGIAGEWGHTPLEPAGAPCYCGRRGCIEAYLSGPGLLRDYRSLGGDRAQDAAHIALLAREGSDALAKAALARYSERLGRALSLIVNVLDPDAIVLGGGLSNIATIYAEGRRQMQPHVFNDEVTTPILRHGHGDASGVRGAAMLWPPSHQRARAYFAKPARSQVSGRLWPSFGQ